MATRPKSEGKSSPTDTRGKIIDALMELAAETRFEDISIRDICTAAAVSLADFRDAFPSKGAVLAGFSRRIDRAVLAHDTGELADENPRERLFDVLMRRLEAMTPYREGVREAIAWLRREPVDLAATASEVLRARDHHGLRSTTAFRPAAAYLGHVRARIKILTRESTHPRDDVATLLEKAEGLQDAVDDLWSGLRQAGDDLRHSEATLAGDIGHARQLLTTDLARLQDAQAADRDAARSRNEELARRIDAMVRRIETTLDGLSDHQELLAGLRALVRMVRADQA